MHELTKAEKQALRAFYYLQRFREECREVGSVVCVRQTFSNIEWSLFYALRHMLGEELCMPDILKLTKRQDLWGKIEE